MRWWVTGDERACERILNTSDLTVLPVTVEHHREPFGIGEPRPRLSWQVRTEAPGWRQAAYEIEIEPLGRPGVVVRPGRLGGLGPAGVGRTAA